VDQPPEKDGRTPAHHRLGDGEGIGTIDMIDAEIPPDVGQLPDGLVKIRRKDRQRNRVDGARGGATQNGEGIARAFAPDIADGKQNADLISRPRPSTRQNQCRPPSCPSSVMNLTEFSGSRAQGLSACE
jgi:hypothetical protein